MRNSTKINCDPVFGPLEPGRDPGGIENDRFRRVSRIFQFSANIDEEKAAAALSTAQLYAIAFGGAITGLIVNAARQQSVDSTLSGISAAALWLCASLCVVAFLAVLSAFQLSKATSGVGHVGTKSSSEYSERPMQWASESSHELAANQPRS